MRRLALVTIVVAVIAPLAPGSALAGPGNNGDSGTVVDKKGDALRAVDITRARFAISQKKIRFAVRVRDLGNPGLFRLTIFPLNSVSDRIDVRRVKGKARAQLYRIDHETTPPTAYPRRCKRMTVAWRKRTDRLVVALPAVCTSSTVGYGPYIFQAAGILGGSTDRSPAKKLNY